jgi:hypothetical protein
MALASEGDILVMRSAVAGIRWATVAVVFCSLELFVTWTWVPKGRLGWAIESPGASRSVVAGPVCRKFRTDWAKSGDPKKSNTRKAVKACLIFIAPSPSAYSPSPFCSSPLISWYHGPAFPRRRIENTSIRKISAKTVKT